MTFTDMFKRRNIGPLSASPVGILVFVALAAILIAIVSVPRGPLVRELILDAMLAGRSQADKVTEFYQRHGRLPQSSEASAFQWVPSGPRSPQSVAWDPDGRRIVITVGEPQSQSGKRFALHAEERDGKLEWTCRTIDLEVKYLPGSCR